MKISKTFPLVLASSSPRRQELIQYLQIPYILHAVATDENIVADLSPEKAVMQLAEEKALASANDLQQNLVYLGADTIVVLNGHIFGKPKDNDEATEMISSLSGQTHQVYTGICLHHPDTKFFACDVCRSDISVAPMSQKEIEDYVSLGDSLDKAGSYGIQGAFAAYVPRIEGCYYNIMGLPLYSLRMLLKKHDLI